MLINATKEKIIEIKDILYELALKPEKSCYPLFSNGIKTKQEFFEYIEACAIKKDYTSLFFTDGENILGLIQYFVIPDDNYLQLCGWYITQNTKKAFDELLAFISDTYPGYNLYFGFSDKNRNAALYLEKHGFSIIESDNHNFLPLREYQPRENPKNLLKVNADNYEYFRRLHQVDESFYWNSGRIFDTIDEWNIYIYNEGNEPAAAIYEFNGEIFGVDYKNGIYNPEALKSLVIKVLNELKTNGNKDLTFFCDDMHQQVLAAIGFKRAGKYNLYHKKI